MIKTLAQIEHKIGDRVYHLMCAANAPLSEVKDALSQFMGHVVAMENAINAKKNTSENQAAPESVVDVPEKVDPQG